MASDLAYRGVPVLFLDVRQRFAFSGIGMTRAALIEAAKAQLDNWCDELLKLGGCETFDACSIAFLKDVQMVAGLNLRH